VIPGGNTQVTDAGLKELVGLESLGMLYLRCTRVTDAGLKELAKLKSLWAANLASAQERPGELGFNVVEDPIQVFDVQATILHLLGLDHTRLTYRVQGRDFRLTDVYGNVIDKILA
jgi:hypothetical protein